MHSKETANQKFEGGILTTISMLGKPEAQRGLQLLLNVAGCVCKEKK